MLLLLPGITFACVEFSRYCSLFGFLVLVSVVVVGFCGFGMRCGCLLWFVILGLIVMTCVPLD